MLCRRLPSRQAFPASESRHSFFSLSGLRVFSVVVFALGIDEAEDPAPKNLMNQKKALPKWRGLG